MFSQPAPMGGGGSSPLTLPDHKSRYIVTDSGLMFVLTCDFIIIIMCRFALRRRRRLLFAWTLTDLLL